MRFMTRLTPSPVAQCSEKIKKAKSAKDFIESLKGLEAIYARNDAKIALPDRLEFHRLAVPATIVSWLKKDFDNVDLHIACWLALFSLTAQVR